jgi:2-polyprenyl-3-methyl-5-hydroxy-6-metoxy-1,4-benzoquinol methylase
MTDAQQPSYKGRVKYTPDYAQNYQVQDAKKDAAERSLVLRAFQHVPPGTVLDVPCGGGRVSQWLAQAGYTVSAGDLSDAMIEIARGNMKRANLPITVDKLDVEHLSHGPQSFDSAVCFRLFHHFPGPEIRGRVIAELCRVSKQYVVLSYFSTFALTSMKRAVQARFFGYKRAKFATSLSEVRGYFKQHGFELVRDYARSALVHTLHVAVFRRVK